MKLYHFSTKTEARRVLASSFQDGTDGGCWLAEAGAVWTICGEKGRQTLLEVTLNLTREQLAPYRREFREETLDDLTGEPIPDSLGERCGPTVWYHIPAKVLNPEITEIRRVPPKERNRLVEGIF
jgi:hypothetical protein